MTFYCIIELEFSASTSSPYFPITGTDAFWDGSVPNPMVGSLNNPTSSLSSIRPEASAAGAGHSLHSQDLGPVPVVPGGGVIPTLSLVTSTVSRSVNSSGSLNPVPGQSMGFNLPSARPPIVSRGTVVLSRLLGFQLLTIGIDPLGCFLTPLLVILGSLQLL